MEVIEESKMIDKEETKRKFGKMFVIDSIYCISDVRKDLYKRIIEQRYDIIREVYEHIK